MNIHFVMISLLVSESKSTIITKLIEKGFEVKPTVDSPNKKILPVIVGSVNCIGLALRINVIADKNVLSEIEEIIDSSNVSHFGYSLVNMTANEIIVDGGNIRRKPLDKGPYR